jgi:Tfp pilus assembly protein PilV
MAIVRKRQASSQDGFTLVEVLVSIMLSAIAVIGIIALYRVQTAASGFSRRATEATVIAEDQLERLRTIPAVATVVTPTDVDEQGFPIVGGFFRRSHSVTPNVALGYADITVTVEWTEDSVRSVVVRGKRKL